MEFVTANNSGFCFGVKRALAIVEKLAEEGEKVYTLGPIIHNKQVTERLRAKGVEIVDEVSGSLSDGVLVIRSHGVGRKTHDEIEALGLRVIDATCPDVEKIHTLAESFGSGDVLLIAGDPEHAEVIGTIGHAGCEAFVFADARQLEEILAAHGEFEEKSLKIVAQTTFDSKEWENCREISKKQCTNATVFDTICKATALRQTEAVQLAQKSDYMIIVGGKNSSNTMKLKNLCEKWCTTYHIETAAELKALDFTRAARIGLAAGASTPFDIIKEVQDTMSEVLENRDMLEAQEAALEQDTVNGAEDSREESFEELLGQFETVARNGSRVKGTVIGTTPTEVLVDIGTKYSGYISLEEFSDDPTTVLKDAVKSGDILDLLVVRVNDVEGTVGLSKKRLEQSANMQKIMSASGTDEIFEGTVVENVGKGLIVFANGTRIFVPMSHSGIPRDGDADVLVKKRVKFKVIDADPEKRRAVGSIRLAAQEVRKEAEEKFWAGVAVGDVRKGTVKSLASYGAFVDIGGLDGMVHISELSWSRIKHPSEVIAVGQELEVYIKDLDQEKRRISLGFKKAADNPWEIFVAKYNAGDVAEVKIVSLTPFGAFAQIIPGVDGLIHISQICEERIMKAADALAVGQVVEAKITEIDVEKKRISLSIRALLAEQQEAAEQAAVEEYNAGAVEAAELPAEDAPENAIEE